MHGEIRDLDNSEEKQRSAYGEPSTNGEGGRGRREQDQRLRNSEACGAERESQKSVKGYDARGRRRPPPKGREGSRSSTLVRSNQLSVREVAWQQWKGTGREKCARTSDYSNREVAPTYEGGATRSENQEDKVACER